MDDYPYSFPSHGKFATHGSAEIVEDELRLTLSLIGVRNGLPGVEMMTVTLDPQTLNGTEKSVGVYSDAVELNEGAFTLTPCQ